MEKTGKGASGDHSEELLSGKIQVKKVEKYSLDLSHPMLEKAQNEYDKTREILIKNSRKNILNTEIN